MNKKWIVSLVLGAALSLLTLYLAFRNVPFSELKSYLGTIKYIWIFPTALLVFLTFVLRVLRWQIILKGYQRIGFWGAYHPLMIGFMMNCVLPGRVGEIARPTILRQRQKVPFSTGLATVAAERIFDILMLVLLFALVFGIIGRQPELEITFGSQQLNSGKLQTIAFTMIRLMVILVLGLSLIIIPWTRNRIIDLINGIECRLSQISPGIQRIAHRIAAFLIQLIRNLTSGLTLIRYPLRILACLVLTVSIWGITLLSYYVFSLGCPGISLTVIELTTVMVVICFFIALPSVPGFWGLWEAGGIFALALFDVPAADAAGFTLVNHAIQLLPVIVAGWISALITSINIWRVVDNKEGKNATAGTTSVECR